MDEWTDRWRTDGQTDIQTDGQRNERMDGWMNGQTNGWMDVTHGVSGCLMVSHDVS